MKLSLSILAAFAASAALADTSATAWSTAASIDFSSGNARRIAPVDVSYSPDFVTGTNTPGGTVELFAVAHYGTYHPVTQTLATVSSPAVGSASFGTAGNSGSAYRIILRAYHGDTLLGEVARDVGLCSASTFTTETLADMSTNKLQRAFDAGAKSLDFAYDSAWTNDTARLVLTCTKKVLPRGPVYTKVLADISSPAVGAHSFITQYGVSEYTFRLAAYDDNGAALGDPLEASYVSNRGGMMLIVR